MLSHFNRVWLFVTLWTVAHKTSPSVGFSRQEYWSCHALPQGIFSIQETWVSCIAGRLFIAKALGKTNWIYICRLNLTPKLSTCASYFPCKQSIWMDSNNMKISIFKSNLPFLTNILNILLLLLYSVFVCLFLLFFFLFLVNKQSHWNLETVPLHSMLLFFFSVHIFQFILIQFNQHLLNAIPFQTKLETTWKNL